MRGRLVRGVPRDLPHAQVLGATGGAWQAGPSSLSIASYNEVWYKKINEAVKSILRITGLTILLLIIILGILYIQFAPEAEIDPKFPHDPTGNFTESPAVDIKDNNINVHWELPTVCSSNTIEFQYEGQGDGNWSGGEGECIETTMSSKCEADLTDRELLKGVTYHLQVNAGTCQDHHNYSSKVVEFTL